MRRRAIELGSIAVAAIALGLLLYNATLVDRRPPSISRVALSATADGNDRLGQTFTAIDLEFSEPVRPESVESRFHLTPYVAGTFTWDGQTAAIFTPSQPLPGAQTFTVNVDAGYLDLAGNAATQPIDPWTFQTVGPPTVVSSDPADGAADFPVDGKIALTFDRLMDTGSVETALQIVPTVAHHLSWSGRVVTVSFDQPLDFGTTYSLDVGDAAADTGGSHLTTAFHMSFATVAAGLGVTATVPTANVAGVSVRSPIAVQFDRPIDPATIANALTITPAVQGSTSVVDVPDDSSSAASPSPSPSTTAAPSGTAGRVLLFTPSGPLAPHTTYTVTLHPVVAPIGESGEVAVGRSWTFTTGQPATTAQNQIAFLSARAGVRNVWLMNPDGSNARQITSETAPVSAFDISANGRTMAVAAGGVVRVGGIDGSQVRTVTPADSFDYAPLLTPDATTLVVGRRDRTGNDRGYWLVPLGGGPARQLLAGGAPPAGSVQLPGDGIADGDDGSAWAGRGAWSADGTRLLLVTGAGEVQLLTTSGSAPLEPVAIDITAASAPVWDGTIDSWLVVANGSSGTGLYRVSLAGISAFLGPGTGSVAVNSAGAIATLRGSGSAAHVAYATRAGEPLSEITTATDLTDREPSFSPDGSTVLFLRVPTGGGSSGSGGVRQSGGIWTADLDGRELRQLSVDGADPRWQP